jgi:hypothetical protein
MVRIEGMKKMRNRTMIMMMTVMKMKEMNSQAMMMKLKTKLIHYA